MTSIKIPNISAYLKEEKHENKTFELVKNIVSYLRQYKVSPKHYTIEIFPDKFIMIQIDKQCGYIDRQVSKSEFEFINGTCFSFDWDKIPILTQKIKIEKNRKNF